jgi:L-aminopeptidase/D-esterase-like protein
VPFTGTPASLNAITGVSGVEAGQVTLIAGEGGPVTVGVGPIRTGITAILPRGKAHGNEPVYAGCDAVIAWYLQSYKAVGRAAVLPSDRMSPFFEATVTAIEEAIINALVAAETMSGANNHRANAIPHERLQHVVRKYNRLAR